MSLTRVPVGNDIEVNRETAGSQIAAAVAAFDISLSGGSAAEFAAAATVVGSLAAINPDFQDTFTFTLLDNAGGRFAIVGNLLQVANGLLLDFEQATSHMITVRVTDIEGLTSDKSFTIAVTDVNPETVTGDEAGNTFFGGALDDHLAGQGGDDVLFGQGGRLARRRRCRSRREAATTLAGVLHSLIDPFTPPAVLVTSLTV